MRFLPAALCIGSLLLATAAEAAPPFNGVSQRLDAIDAQGSTAPRASATYQPNMQTMPQSDYSPSGSYPSQGGWYNEAEQYYGGGWGEPCGACCERAWKDCPPPGWWGRAEYLVWWVRGSNTPALVTGDPDGGVLPDATVLFGGDRIDRRDRNGGRFTLGYWACQSDEVGLEATFFFLGDQQDWFFAESNATGTPLLARPFFNVQSGAQDSLLVASQGVISGTIGVNTNSRPLGFELNMRRGLWIDCGRRCDLLAGFRYFQLKENLEVESHTVSINQPPIPVGTITDVFDSFKSNNNFYGVQLGINAQRYFCRWDLDVTGKVALGSMSQRVAIDGRTVTTVPEEEPVTQTGGALALTSNSGQFSSSQFAVLPELDINLRYRLSHRWKLGIGYSLLIATNVARASEQIDTQIDPRNFPPPQAGGTPNPQFRFSDSDVRLQGVNFSLESVF